MTSDRWDTRDHADADPRRNKPNGRPYPPWHDATTALTGPITGAFAELVRARWLRAGGGALSPVAGRIDCWPQHLAPHFRNVDVAIARTVPQMGDDPGICEIERLYVDMIRSAKRIIYAESQYFASRHVAEAIAARLCEPDGPEIVLINPVTAHGWLEPIAMDTARARLFEAMRPLDVGRRFRIYHPVTAAGVQIYVHAKVMIVDDAMIRVGSSNMNNRSMRLDTECDVAILCANASPAIAGPIREIRESLIAEHLGITVAAFGDRFRAEGSLIAAIEGLRGDGRTLRPYETPDLGSVSAWLADNEVLDPEGPGEMFESLSRRGLFRRAQAWRDGHRLRRSQRRR